MKILHVYGGGDKGGGKTHILPLCQQLSENSQNNLTLVCLRKGAFHDDATKMGIKTKLIHTGMTLVDYVRFIRYIRREKPDIVHCHGAKANLAGSIARFFSKAMFTTTIHSDYRLDYMHSFWRRQLFGRLNALALRGFDYFVAVSDNFKKMLIARGFHGDKIMPIYNGLDFDIKCPPFDKTAYLQELGLDYDGSQVVLGIPARLNPVKDIPTLLHAFAKAYSQNPKLRLLIGGEGESAQMLKDLAKELHIDKVVCFCGWVYDIQKFFACCDIDVLCSISESFPYSILEGIREGCAIISSDVGGLTRMIVSGEDGFIFQSRDVDTFASYITTLANDPQLRKTFAERLYAKASGLYSLKNMAARQEEIYRDMTTLHSRRGKQGVLICGAYGRGNSGDEAILEAIITSMREIDPLIPITVMTRKPEETKLLHDCRAVYTFNFLKFIPIMLKNKLFISGGGSLIQNVTSTRSLFFYLSTIFFAHLSRCKVLMYGCGIGQVHGRFVRWLTKRVINPCATVITVRDSISQQELADLGITRPKVILSADPAFSLPHAEQSRVSDYFRSQGLGENQPYICFSLRRWKDFDNFAAYARAAEYAYEKHGLQAVFLPIEVPKDLEPIKKVAEHLHCPYTLLENPKDIPLILGILKQMQVVCSMRLHALVFAASAGTPFVATSYDIKVSSFMADAGKGELSCDLDGLQADWLCHAIDTALAQREDYKAIAQVLREKEAINDQEAQALLL